MIGLSDAQFEMLEQQLKKSELARIGLYHDLLDHYYCLTESFMQQGFAFEEAAQKALTELAPEGFDTIENELNFLLTFKFQIKMKRLMYSGGFASSFCISLFFLFKIQHWPGSGWLAITGFGILLLVLVPTLFVSLIQNSADLSRAEKIRFVTGLFAAIFLAGGGLFKVGHWPGASAQLVLGFVLLSFVFLPLFFWQLYQKSASQLAV